MDEIEKTLEEAKKWGKTPRVAISLQVEMALYLKAIALMLYEKRKKK